MDINVLQSVVTDLQLADDDVIYNVRMPDKSCDICGGYGIKDWEGEHSVLCECIDTIDTDRELMPFRLLKKLSTITKSEVFNG